MRKAQKRTIVWGGQDKTKRGAMNAAPRQNNLTIDIPTHAPTSPDKFF